MRLIIAYLFHKNILSFHERLDDIQELSLQYISYFTIIYCVRFIGNPIYDMGYKFFIVNSYIFKTLQSRVTLMFGI